MKVVILAGGRGTRLAEQTDVIPKPMLQIGGQPILWHIMKHFAHFGFHEFVIALGYKGDIIKRYFTDYYRQSGNLSINLRSGQIDVTSSNGEDWKVDLIDTGPETQTGGRIKRLNSLLAGEKFFLTYGDGLSNVPIDKLIKFHDSRNAIATITAVHPPARFGRMAIDEDGQVSSFVEKAQTGEGWINGGFMVFDPEVMEYFPNDDFSLEYVALSQLADAGKLAAFRHNDFWMCMDTLRDKLLLQRLWEQGAPPWKTWL
jgi:glucose-1-phosphate cytidylyltransferase